MIEGIAVIAIITSCIVVDKNFEIQDRAKAGESRKEYILASFVSDLARPDPSRFYEPDYKVDIGPDDRTCDQGRGADL
jgi:hypothetical protein